MPRPREELLPAPRAGIRLLLAKQTLPTPGVSPATDRMISDPREASGPRQFASPGIDPSIPLGSTNHGSWITPNVSADRQQETPRIQRSTPARAGKYSTSFIHPRVPVLLHISSLVTVSLLPAPVLSNRRDTGVIPALGCLLDGVLDPGTTLRWPASPRGVRFL
ncbi:unnamed protein product [Trypanosoma congolense IL3000]|uniref:WGS project CAEQ00000000 data, annotated contig 875 n=1 Tax=Trypanosoma congolense (strain IL3000) TaxID=1068625 RepID=F9WJ60_TRYCI|nr:unnamed protein product [Trypanosoma congolense IL3000]